MDKITNEDKIGKNDRVNIPPVKLQLNDKDMQPVNVGKPFDIQYHLRRPAKEEFREMVDAGIVVPNDEPSDWRSQAFPRMKPEVTHQNAGGLLISGN